MHEVLGSLLNLVFPPRCRLCGTPANDAICAGCIADFPRVTGNICTTCGKPCARAVTACRSCVGKQLHFSRARAAGHYAGVLKEAIRQLKYKNGKRIAPYLARFATECVPGFADGVDGIAFVPLTSRKEAIRGYNQSGLVAQEISRLYDTPLYRGLIKVRNIPEQNKLGLADRARNIKGAFAATTRVSGRILLIDDVYTTGNTVNECALALRRQGASEVRVLTVARTPLEGR